MQTRKSGVDSHSALEIGWDSHAETEILGLSTTKLLRYWFGGDGVCQWVFLECCLYASEMRLITSQSLITITITIYDETHR